jgi:hypothetical protein
LITGWRIGDDLGRQHLDGAHRLAVYGIVDRSKARLIDTLTSAAWHLMRRPERRTNAIPSSHLCRPPA